MTIRTAVEDLLQDHRTSLVEYFNSNSSNAEFTDNKGTAKLRLHKTEPTRVLFPDELKMERTLEHQLNSKAGCMMGIVELSVLEIPLPPLVASFIPDDIRFGIPKHPPKKDDFEALLTAVSQYPRWGWLPKSLALPGVAPLRSPRSFFRTAGPNPGSVVMTTCLLLRPDHWFPVPRIPDFDLNKTIQTRRHETHSVDDSQLLAMYTYNVSVLIANITSSKPLDRLKGKERRRYPISGMGFAAFVNSISPEFDKILKVFDYSQD